MSSDKYDSLANELMSKLLRQFGNASGNSNNGNGNVTSSSIPVVPPSSALVILGLLTGSLEVTSVLVDKTQLVQIVISGSLKQKTELEKMIDQIGKKPFDDVVKAFLSRL